MARRNPSQEDIALDRLPKAPINRESLRQTLALTRYIHHYRARFLAGLATLFISATLGLAFPLLAGSLIDSALHPDLAKIPVLGILSLNQVALLLAARNGVILQDQVRPLSRCRVCSRPAAAVVIDYRC